MPRLPLLLLLALLLSAAPAVAITLGQVDDFESETAEGWEIGLLGDPAVQASGGPGGVGDAYLEPTADGSGGAGGRLVVFNAAQWAGDYTGAGVGTIALDAVHLSGSDVSLRVSLRGPSGTVVSALPIVISPPGVWEALEFSLDPIDLLFLTGSGDVAGVLSNVTSLRILSSAEVPDLGNDGVSARGERIAATIGIDNITALPEPDAAPLVALAAVAAGSCLTRRRRGIGGAT